MRNFSKRDVLTRHVLLHFGVRKKKAKQLNVSWAACIIHKSELSSGKKDGWEDEEESTPHVSSSLWHHSKLGKALELHEDKTRRLSEHLQLLEKVELSMLGGSRSPPPPLR